jgi:hypothetical protein
LPPDRHVRIRSQSLEISELALCPGRVGLGSAIVWGDQQGAPPGVECGLEVLVSEVGTAVVDQQLDLPG